MTDDGETERLLVPPDGRSGFITGAGGSGDSEGKRGEGRTKNQGTSSPLRAPTCDTFPSPPTVVWTLGKDWSVTILPHLGVRVWVSSL